MSSDDGIPQTPDTVFVPDLYSPRHKVKHDTDFACLVPDNDDAKEAFDEVVNELKSNPERNPHARQFIFVDGLKRELEKWSGSETESGLTEDARALWTGHYCLSFECLPDDVGRGWIIGGGRHDLPNQGVDILLTLQKAHYRVHGRHARLRHTDSGTLMLYTGKRRVVVNGVEKLEGSRQMASSVTSLTFGRLSYLFKWVLVEEEEYRKQLRRVQTHFGIKPSTMPRSLELTPSETTYEYKGFFFQAPFAGGTFGTILAGTEKSTGKAVVVKRLKRTRQNSRAIDLEIAVYRKLGTHVQFRVCSLLQHFSSSDDALQPRTSSVDDVFLILQPLLHHTFYDLTNLTHSLEVRLEAFHQVLEGLEYLHGLGIMHRDIKLTNLMVSLEPTLRAVITDFGDATFDCTSADHMKGTIPFLAPEIILLKEEEEAKGQAHAENMSGDKNASELQRSNRQSTENNITQPAVVYDNSIDVWALGICAYLLLYQQKCSWSRINAENYHNIMTVVRSKSGISDVIADMIAWDSEDRPSASCILRRDLWHK